jgi:Mn2+/Fe2+ NRAMP family transporter
VVRQIIAPTITPDPGYLTTLVTLVGTTVTPYMLFYLQSSLSDKGVTLEEQAKQRADVVVGAVLSDLIALFIIVSTAATLHPHGIRVESAENAARALKPLAGPYAEALFGIGLSGASMLAASVLPLTTAYAICGAFGWERGVSRTWSEAPIFNGLYTTLIVVGAAFVLIPGRSLIELILRTQTLNGLLLPIILIFVTRLANDRSVLDRHTNGRLFNVLAYGTTGALVALTVVLLAAGVLGGA